MAWANRLASLRGRLHTKTGRSLRFFGPEPVAWPVAAMSPERTQHRPLLDANVQLCG
jgi:hypothetical protein